jgi:hypothetical protein
MSYDEEVMEDGLDLDIDDTLDPIDEDLTEMDFEDEDLDKDFN